MSRWIRPLLALLGVAALVSVSRAAPASSLPDLPSPAPTLMGEAAGLDVAIAHHPGEAA